MVLSLNNSGMMAAVNNLTRLGNMLAVSNERLTSGKRINRASDDPSGIIAATNLNASIARQQASIDSAARIGSIVSTADGAMSEISDLLISIETNVIAAADSGATAEEKIAYQAEIDLALNSIDRIVNTTSFNGNLLLNGDMGYTTSGVTSTELADVSVESANIASGSASVSVEVTEATVAAVTADFYGAALADTGTLEITGNNGTETINFFAGDTKAVLAGRINAETANTGVTAVEEGGTLVFKSVSAGSDQFVTVDAGGDSFDFVDGVTSDYGEAASATVNGTTASVSGNDVYFGTSTVSGRITLSNAFLAAGGTSSFTVTGGGSDWSLGLNSYDSINYGVSSLDTSSLGNSVTGYLSSLRSGGANDINSGNSSTAQSVIDSAQSQVSRERGRLGAVQSYALDATTNALNASIAALSEEYSSIMDLDYVEEAANNERLTTMMQIGSNVISAMNANTSNILSLLNGAFS